MVVFSALCFQLGLYLNVNHCSHRGGSQPIRTCCAVSILGGQNGEPDPPNTLLHLEVHVGEVLKNNFCLCRGDGLQWNVGGGGKSGHRTLNHSYADRTWWVLCSLFLVGPLGSGGTRKPLSPSNEAVRMGIPLSCPKEGIQDHPLGGKTQTSLEIYSRGRHPGRESMLPASCPAHCGQGAVDYLRQPCEWPDPILETHTLRGLGLRGFPKPCSWKLAGHSCVALAVSPSWGHGV